MKIMLSLFFLLAPGQQPQGVQIEAPTIEECLRAAGEFLNKERFKDYTVRGATCAVILGDTEAKQ